ncbi:MAG: hypothetical protein VW080_10625, partial [Flavobacteriaceae bacterium]
IIFAKDALKEILPVLFIRAGLGLFFTTCTLNFCGINNGDEILFYLVLALSSVSFWPFAHMSLIDGIEKRTQ